MSGMAVVKGRAKRRGVSDNPQLAVRISPKNFAKLDYAADANGISKAAIVDWMVDRLELDENGRPIGWPGSLPRDRQELPPTRSA
jgi:hypothetical protein